MEKDYVAFSLIDSAKRNHTNKEYNKALSELDQSLSIKNDTAFAYFLRTVIFTEIGNYDEAVRSIDRAIAIIPNSDDNYYWRGIANYRKGNYAWAIEDFNQAIRLSPKDDEYYSCRAAAYMDAGNYKEARKDAEKAISINQSSDGYMILARICDFTGDYRNQLQYCEKIIALSGDDYDGLSSTLMAYYMMGKFREAIVVGERIVNGNMLYQAGDIANIYGILASCCCGLGEADKALHYVEKEIKVRYNGELENVELAKRDIGLEITRLANIMSEKKLAWGKQYSN